MRDNMKMDVLKAGSRKGQAMMEYLMTYGLALFVILVVLAILVAVVLPNLQAPEACQFTQPGFTCNQKPHALVSDANTGEVKMLFQLDNAQGKSVELEYILCTSAPTGNVRKSDAEAFGAAVPTAADQDKLGAGQSKTVGDPASDIDVVVTCVDENGDPLQMSAGTNFRGSLAVVYSFADDVPGAPSRLAVATVSGNVQAE